MDLNRPLYPVAVTLAAAAITGVAAVTWKRRARRGGVDEHGFRDMTGGCTPDQGPYMDAQIIVHDVDGSNQGIAIAILRDRLLPTEHGEEDNVEPLLLDYDEAIRSMVEVAIHLALELAEAEIDSECSCGDEDCDSGEVDNSVMPLVAGRKLTEFALSFEQFAFNHAAECRICAAEGRDAPAYLRAQFCRDLADDLLTNFESSDLTMRGIPIPAAFEVVKAMVEVIEQTQGVSVEDQINRLGRSVASSIAHKEGHASSEQG